MDGPTRYHSVLLDEDACKGCTLCVTTCPTEAIRVRGGKARIMEERCIDCGKCIRRCPNHAKKARVDALAEFAPGGKFAGFDIKVALPAPSLYGQFPGDYSIPAIHRALLECGFDAVFPVSAATGPIARAARRLLDRNAHPDIPRPLISSSCPTIIKFIQIRFPTLLEHIVPIIAPMELAGRLAREEIERQRPISGEKTLSVGCFFISPCSGKITEALAPLGNEPSSVDGVFSMKDVHLPILQALQKSAGKNDPASGGAEAVREPPAKSEPAGNKASYATAEPSGIPAELAREIAWGRAGGEAEATVDGTDFRFLAVDGMDQCIKILEEIENGKLAELDLLELMSCTGGCVGGPLAAINPAIAKYNIRERERKLAEAIGDDGHGIKAAHETLVEDDSRRNTRTSREAQSPSMQSGPGGIPRMLGNSARTLECERCLRTEEFPARPALLLDPDFRKAMAMMDEMEKINEKLPGLDCGCCGAPNCHALAEDIVRGSASLTDCIVILKEQYRELLEKGGQ